MPGATDASLFEQRHHVREQLLTMTERLVAEYAGILPAGSVMRCVSRCWVQARLAGGPVDVVDETEATARRRLSAMVPATASPEPDVVLIDRGGVKPAMTNAHEQQFARHMLDLADQLFDEHAHLPLMTVLGALNQARRELTGPDGEPPAPATLAVVVRQRLSASTPRSLASA